MPDVEDLMQEWPAQFEEALKEVHTVVTLVIVCVEPFGCPIKVAHTQPL